MLVTKKLMTVFKDEWIFVTNINDTLKISNKNVVFKLMLNRYCISQSNDEKISINFETTNLVPYFFHPNLTLISLQFDTPILIEVFASILYRANSRNPGFVYL